jgi:hypothetical protein
VPDVWGSQLAVTTCGVSFKVPSVSAKPFVGSPRPIQSMASALRFRLPALGAGIAATAGALVFASGTGWRFDSNHVPAAGAAETTTGGTHACDCAPMWACMQSKCNGEMPCPPCAALETQLRACLARVVCYFLPRSMAASGDSLPAPPFLLCAPV